MATSTPQQHSFRPLAELLPTNDAGDIEFEQSVSVLLRLDASRARRRGRRATPTRLGPGLWLPGRTLCICHLPSLCDGRNNDQLLAFANHQLKELGTRRQPTRLVVAQPYAIANTGSGKNNYFQKLHFGHVLRRQEGEMSQTREERCQRSSERGRSAPATPAGSHQSGLGPVGPTRCAAGLASCPTLAPRGAAYPRRPHRDGRVASHGRGGGAPRHHRPWRPEPGDLVRTASPSHAGGTAEPPPGAGGCHECPRGGRSGGTPRWTDKHGDRRRSGGGPLLEDAWQAGLRPARGRDAALGARAVAAARVGVPGSARAVLAGRAAWPAPAPHQGGLGAAADDAGPPLAAGAPPGAGGGRRRGRQLTGPGVCQESGGHGVARALGGRAGARAGAPLPGKRGPTPGQGTRPRRVQGGAARAETPWEPAAGDWDGGKRTPWWGCSYPARWSTPRGPPVAIRVGLVCDPERQWPMAAFCCTALAATPGQSLAGVVRRWSVAVTCEATRAQLGLETPRQGSDRAIARTTPVLLALVSLVTVFARRWSPDGQMPVPVTAWYHNDEPTFADCLAWGRRPLWRARS